MDERTRKGVIESLISIDERTNHDLDSITVGSPSRAQIKLYFNSSDPEELIKVKERIAKAVDFAEYANSLLVEKGLVILKKGGE